MKSSFVQIVLAALVLVAAPVFAADAKRTSALDGTWTWEFAMPDAGTIKPTLKVSTDKDGTVNGVARFRSGSSTPVKDLKLKGDEVSFEVHRSRFGETNVTRYSGRLQGDKIVGRILSNWTGEQQAYDWVATRASGIEGTWKWRLTFGTNAPGGGNPGARRPSRPGGGGGFGEYTLTLKMDAEEKLTGKLNSMGRDQEIKRSEFKDKQIRFETDRVRSDGESSTNYYWGTFTGDAINGKFTTDAGGVLRTNDWKAARAE